MTRIHWGAKIREFGAAQRAQRFLDREPSGLLGSNPALPPMAESLGALSSTVFGGEIVENGYKTV